MAEPLGTVVLFARAPRFGRGKRRIARETGDLVAHVFYRGALARMTRVVAAEAGWRTIVALDPVNDVWRPGPPFSHGRAARLPRRPQRRGHLGRRMLAALADAPPGPAVLIGADIPGVTPAALKRALKACRTADFVFGPAEDGGFWLIGSRRRPPLRMLDGVGWSKPTTLAETVAALPKPARVKFVDTLRDVDIAADIPQFP